MTTAVKVSNHGDLGEVQYYIHFDRRIVVQEIPD